LILEAKVPGKKPWNEWMNEQIEAGLPVTLADLRQRGYKGSSSGVAAITSGQHVNKSLADKLSSSGKGNIHPPGQQDKAHVGSVKNVLNIAGATGTTVPREIGPLGESDGTLRVATVVTHSSTAGKILGTSAPGGSATAVYTVPDSTTVEVTTLTACNQTKATQTVRVAILAGGGTTPATAEYIYYDTPLEKNRTLLLDAAQGMWLEAGATIVVSASSTAVSFVATGKEHT
jgi:hypothetical protein